MKLYTSYFAQIRNFPQKLVGLSTAIWNPKWLTRGRSQNGIIWFDVPPLKPGPTCEGLCCGACKPKQPENCSFLYEYRKQLDDIDINDFINKLEKLKIKIEQGEKIKNIEFAFLVYEVENNLCSERQAIQQWLRDNKIEISEWHR